MMPNLLIHGENLKALRYLLESEQLAGMIDLIYIDPPFATGGQFTVSEGRTATISTTKAGELVYDDRLAGADFLAFLRERLCLLRELLSPRGSIYLHIDYKVGHYVKILMDDIFGIEHFRNDITRIKCNPKNFRRRGYGNIKDMVLFYTRGPKPIWHEPRSDYSEADLVKLFPKTEPGGRRYTTVPIHAPGETRNGRSSQPFRGMLPPKGRHWRTDVETLEAWDRDGLLEWSSRGNPRRKIYADERDGKRMQDIWEFKDPQYPVYPTEKNLQMLELIVRTSSNPDSIVLDCFCGSGTTLKAAQHLGRKWIGIDQSALAIEATRNKLAPSEGSLFAGHPDFEYLELTTG